MTNAISSDHADHRVHFPTNKVDPEAQSKKKSKRKKERKKKIMQRC